MLAFIIKPEPFYSIGQFYENCEQVSDDEIGKIMKRHGYKEPWYEMEYDDWLKRYLAIEKNAPRYLGTTIIIIPFDL